ncbi:hypothetical protein C8F04DRAFT_1180733 [Mycena alexandri]|uniref:Uncharacterized protein n=1 Tax=Mycena alexandri TaxID=1745969 RepID=A0AAD6X5H2_9AGAR|nr:hypothetical protein C8F04DRAFT_1180733 [Mycena alexandri]
MSNFGRGHASSGPLSNLQMVTQAQKPPKSSEKAKFSLGKARKAEKRPKVRKTTSYVKKPKRRQKKLFCTISANFFFSQETRRPKDRKTFVFLLMPIVNQTPIYAVGPAPGERRSLQLPNFNRQSDTLQVRHTRLRYMGGTKHFIGTFWKAWRFSCLFGNG